VSVSKAWTWEVSTDDIWNHPSEDVYYYVERWKELGLQRVLDLGCGIGRNTLLLARNGFAVSGLDLSAYGIEQTGLKLEQAVLHVALTCADINKLPYADNSFDALLAYHVISHTDSVGIVNILNEMKRVVKPGGELYFTLCSKDSPSFQNNAYTKLDENTVLKVDGPEQGIPHFYSDEQSLPYLLSGMTILKLRHTKDVFEGSYSWHYFILCRNDKG